MYAVMLGVSVDYSTHAVGHMCNVTNIFIHGNMPIMWSICIPVHLARLLIALYSYELYIHSCLMCAWNNLHMWHLRGIFVVGTCMGSNILV